MVAVFPKRSWIFVFCCLLAVSTAGCDFINTVKEYFQEPTEKTVSKPSLPATPEQVPAAQPVKPAAEAPSAANVLARVGNWTITTEEFNERLNALREAIPDFDVADIEAKKMVLNELVNQQLVVADAEQRGLANQKDIDAAVEEFRRTLIVREAVRGWTENITVPDEEIAAFYEEQKALLVQPARWHVRSIVVDSQLKANELSVELLKGTDFAEMAKQNSIAQNAAQGGDLGFIEEAPFPEMATALLPLSPGDISGVFKGPEGYYIVKLEEKKEGEQIPLETIKEEIRQNQLMMKQQKVITDHIEQIKGKIKVEVKEGLLGQ